MAKVFKPSKPKASDSLEKHLKYVQDQKAWDAALMAQDKAKEVKKLIAAGEFDKAMKLNSGKGSAKKVGAKRKSLNV